MEAWGEAPSGQGKRESGRLALRERIAYRFCFLSATSSGCFVRVFSSLSSPCNIASPNRVRGPWHERCAMSHAAPLIPSLVQLPREEFRALSRACLRALAAAGRLSRPGARQGPELFAGRLDQRLVRTRAACVMAQRSCPGPRTLLGRATVCRL